MQHQIVRFYNRGRECLLRGMNWVCKSDKYNFILTGLNYSLTQKAPGNIRYQIICRKESLFLTQFYISRLYKQAIFRLYKNLNPKYRI